MLTALALVSVPVAGAFAQEGAAFLRVPVGARAVSQGQAVAASRMGADGIWWNPASLAWLKDREVGLNYSSNFILTGTSLDLVYPAGRAGVLSASALFYNIGEQTATDRLGNSTGTFYTSALVTAASYAATFGDKFAAALTYKLIRQTQTCSGSCPDVDTYSVRTNAFDLGFQSVRGKAGELTLGAVVRDVGFCAQIIDSEQCDPLPSRFHLGAEYRVDAVSKARPGLTLRVSGEVVTRLSLAEPTLRFGAELGVAERLFLRAGVLPGISNESSTGSGDGSKAAIGFSIRQGTLALDFARTFGGLSSDNGNPPTYVTLRMAFR